MGRVNKKKLSEYTESVEIEDKSSETGKDSPRNKSTDDGIMDVDDLESVHETSKKKSFSIDIDADDDDSSVAQENEKNGNSVSDNKSPKKRKAAASSGGSDKKKKDAADNDDSDEESDDMPLNGKGGSNSARKNNKSKGAAKRGAKNAKKAQKSNEDPVVVDDDDNNDDNGEGEEEYEVKDIVDHKTERGISYFLIRWKGYTKADDTWEAEDTLSCPDIIDKYKKKISTSGNNKTGKKSAATPSKKGKRGGGGGSTNKSDDNDKEWEVEKIIDYAEEKNGRIFRIRWKGFSAKNDTWEPEENLSCDDIIDKFMKRMSEQKDVSFKELRQEPKKTKRLVNETSPRTNYTNPIGRKSKRSGNKKRIFYGDMDE